MQNTELNLKTLLSPAFLEIWDNSLLGVLILDIHGVIRYINRLLILTDDLQDEDIIGKKMVDFYPLERDCHMSIQTIETGKPIIKKTIVYYTRKNKLVNSLSSTFPLFSGNEVEGVIHFSLNLQTSQSLLERHQDGSAKISQDIVSEKKPYTFDSLIGEDPSFKNAINNAKSGSQTGFSVFIWAESGCGKELFAQSIHCASARQNRPFIPINCAAIPDNLLETTLFGTSKGAFTGATEKTGLLEEAQGGTLLMDELNSMSLELQAKLLRAVQEKKIRRVGALKEIPVDVRFISTCNIPPSEALDKNKIRMDLFYRLAVVVLEIPPLRKRKSDIPLLCNHFLRLWADDSEQNLFRLKQQSISVSDEVYEIFDSYPWPGNVRELEHTLKAALTMLHDAAVIEPRHLSTYFMSNYNALSIMDSAASTESGLRNGNGESAIPVKTAAKSLQYGKSAESSMFADQEIYLNSQDQGKICLNSTMKNIESVYIQRALTQAGYNISKAGRFLNLSPQALRYKISKLGIHVPVE